MGQSRSMSRRLDKYQVALAERTARAKHELAMQMVAERVKTDAEFAAKVLEIGGVNLRENIKKDAEATLKRHAEEVNKKEYQALVETSAQKLADDVDSKFVENVTTFVRDGGGEVLMSEVPDVKPNADVALDDPPVWEK